VCIRGALCSRGVWTMLMMMMVMVADSDMSTDQIASAISIGHVDVGLRSGFKKFHWVSN
jgi:hypothetical protein